MVEVGLTLVEPVAEVDVKVPGVMARLVAPVTDQLNVVLEPGLMPVGFAANDVIVGGEPFPEEDDVPPQAAKPRQAKIRINADFTRWRARGGIFVRCRQVQDLLYRLMVTTIALGGSST